MSSIGMLRCVMGITIFLICQKHSHAYSNGYHETLNEDEEASRLLEYLWCPSKLVGTMCPEDSLTYYYNCCGEFNNKCCHNTRLWVLVTSIVVPLLILIGIVAILIQKFCLNRNRRYIPGRHGDDMVPEQHQRNITSGRPP